MDAGVLGALLEGGAARGRAAAGRCERAGAPDVSDVKLHGAIAGDRNMSFLSARSCSAPVRR